MKEKNRCLQLICVFCLFFSKVNNYQGAQVRWTHRNLLPDEEEFGSRIVGGEDISITQVPYQVSLQYFKEHYCGGAIITSNHVITAAHCTTDVTAPELNIRAGSTYHGYGGVVRGIKHILTHPLYDDSKVDYDIAILIVSCPIPINNYMRPVPMARKGTQWAIGTPGLVSGWGLLFENSDSSLKPENLQGTVLQILDVGYCKRRYGDTIITERMLCVGVPEGGKDSCQGDSGGPLVIDGVLAGLVSFGKGCARPGVPGVYTNIAVLSEFIEYATSVYQ